MAVNLNDDEPSRPPPMRPSQKTAMQAPGGNNIEALQAKAKMKAKMDGAWVSPDRHPWIVVPTGGQLTRRLTTRPTAAVSFPAQKAKLAAARAELKK